MKNAVYILLAFAIPALAGCQDKSKDLPSAGDIIAHLPKALGNNAVAMVGDTAYSFAGLYGGKSWRDVTAAAYACALDKGTCRALAPLPDGVGRLAATAVTVHGKIYIFGGYSVAEDGAEKSMPEVWIFDPKSETYTRAADMPLPVDDSVALTYQDRYVYLVSGWHDHDNVAAVQVLDTHENRWFSATDYPGAPVFGHAGARVGSQLLICGGVKVVPPIAPQKRRSFALSTSCWRGQISDDAHIINWTKAGDTAPGAAYRRAAFGLPNGEMVFYGGTLTPYNYNGIGYNGDPSMPIPRMDIARLSDNGQIEWRTAPAPPGMDYRGAGLWQNALITLGGMDENQQVVDRVQRLRLPFSQ